MQVRGTSVPAAAVVPKTVTAHCFFPPSASLGFIHPPLAVLVDLGGLHGRVVQFPNLEAFEPLSLFTFASFLSFFDKGNYPSIVKTEHKWTKTSPSGTYIPL